MTALRIVYASVIDLRTDEAYYWTWSKENVLSFLDHPPMIAWFIRFGTAIFGDTNLGVRFAGILAMLVTQLLLADIVRRVTHDVRAIVLAVLMPEAALYYGLLMAKVAPDIALIPFAVAMIWSLVRLDESDDRRWWLAAGVFGGLSLLSKFTVVMLLPAVAAFMLVPDWRRRWRPPVSLAAALIAVVLFLPVLIWNAGHDWASFRFQLVRATATHEWSLRTVGDFIGLQWGLVGFVLLPVVLSGVTLTAWRGYRDRDAVAILLSTAVIVPFLYFFWKSLTLRVGDTWPMFMWPAGFAAAAINIAMLPREGFPAWMIRSTIRWANSPRSLPASSMVVAGVSVLCRQPLEFHRPCRSDRRRGGLRAGGDARQSRIAEDRRDLDRDHGLPHLCDAALVLQRPRAGYRSHRARPVSGLSRSRHGSDRGPCRASMSRVSRTSCSAVGGDRRP